MAKKTSPFFSPGIAATADSLAIVHLKRDHQIPAILRERDDDDEGYKEGKVVNTQFGCFPHSTLIGLPWGAQVRASKVDTGSRGRRGKGGEKRKRDVSEVQDTEDPEKASQENKAAVTASSGFMHVLYPTPENWTSSLSHRTQIVYTPDYSYILHRLRVVPGSNIIEAGAGSGSFTHASARAVYNGYPTTESSGSLAKRRKVGKVWSFEFHEQRHSKLKKEIQDHGLEGIVQITHRDVCQDGFLVGPNDDESPNVEAIFLDLPAPWLALPHLTRQPTLSKSKDSSTEDLSPHNIESMNVRSPLNPHSPVHICAFSPCIEQVQRTVSTLRRLGWVDISMVEIANKRLEVRRERVGIENGGLLGVAANVEEAVSRLKEIEGRFKSFHTQNGNHEDVDLEKETSEGGNDTTDSKQKKKESENPNSRQRLLESLVDRKMYKEGRLVHRAEQEVKLHTSYLLFAVLPQEWSAEDERKARMKWPVSHRECGAGVRGKAGNFFGVSGKQMKKEAQREQSDSKKVCASKEGLQAEPGKELEDNFVLDEMLIDKILPS